MKCLEVQNALWSGKKSDEVLQHIETCFACQREAADIQQIVNSLRQIDIPAPSRSLVPSADVIRKTVQMNRRRPIKMIASIATAAAVLLAVVTEMALDHRAVNPAPFTVPGESDKTKWSTFVGDPALPAIEILPEAGNPEILEAIRAYFTRTASADEVKRIQVVKLVPDPNSKEQEVTGVVMLNIELQPGVVSKYKPGPQKQHIALTKKDGSWSVTSFQFENTVQDPNLAERITWYYNKVNKSSGVREIKLVEFTPDPDAEEKAMTGIVTLDVDLQPGANSSFKQGKNTRYVLLAKRQGVWDVIDESATHRFSIKDAPAVYRDLDKVGEIIEGIISEVQVSELSNAIRLHTLKISIEKNYSDKTSPFRSFSEGETIEVTFEEDLPRGISRPHIPQKGERIIAYVGQLDPAIAAGELKWYSKLSLYYYLRDGNWYDIYGNQANPLKK